MPSTVFVARLLAVLLTVATVTCLVTVWIGAHW